MNECKIGAGQINPMRTISRDEVGAQCKQEMYNPTVGENIDRRIAQLEIEIETLKRAKVDMASMLNIRIDDMRRAMNY